MRWIKETLQITLVIGITLGIPIALLIHNAGGF